MLNPIILSGFADESAENKQAEQQFAAMAAAGLQHYSIRFIDVGGGIKNAMALTKAELKTVVKLQANYGLSVATLGSPIGKVKLLDVDDGTSNKFIPFKNYLAKEVKHACDVANTLGTKLLRGFSFYHPMGTDPADHLNQVSDQLGAIAEVCAAEGLVFGLEVEANLVGQTGKLLAKIHRQVKNSSLVLIFDGANLVCQGMTPDEVFAEYLAMKPGLGWLHIKDYRHSSATQRMQHVDETSLKNFVPADLGDTGHEAILRDLVNELPKIEKRMKKLGAPGVIFDLEPHVKGGGQFGGFSGPDGFGVALRGLCRLLDYTGIPYHLTDFDDILKRRD
ncbi:Xylose isomerase-like TIM barrel [Aureliella helgolandensis]|uniref:Xylose isomerase-like TIM barrel n=2 Tax=Aureliella helgolandensis TaxID=2527968 RepID=A0A518G1E1_9BACT|nr:TIM barrel protein [Aureliella helgolandensis]QDV22417.1 Xylose isomerase-like TIM barrel [Aureliella helgolandensis]